MTYRLDDVAGDEKMVGYSQPRACGPSSATRLDDADLALLEIGDVTPLVQSLIEEIRCLRDEILLAQVDAEEARARGDDMQDQLEEAEDDARALQKECDQLEEQLEAAREERDEALAALDVALLEIGPL